MPPENPTIREHESNYRQIDLYIDTAMPSELPDRILPYLRKIECVRHVDNCVGWEGGEPVYDEAGKWIAHVVVMKAIEAVAATQEEALAQLAKALTADSTPASIDNDRAPDQMRHNVLHRVLRT